MSKNHTQKKAILGFIDKTMIIYALLGILNYGFCNFIMLVLDNELHVPFPWYLIICFAMQSTISFVLNRYVTFRGLKISKYWPLKFIISVGLCYLGAKVLLYKACCWAATETEAGIAFSTWVKGLLGTTMEVPEVGRNISNLLCTFIYCVINYIGQRYFVFREQRGEETPQTATEPDPSGGTE